MSLNITSGVTSVHSIGCIAVLLVSTMAIVRHCYLFRSSPVKAIKETELIVMISMNVKKALTHVPKQIENA